MQKEKQLKRINQDLAGIAQRIHKLQAEWEIHSEEVQTAWKDSNSRDFFRHQVAEVQPTIQQLQAAINECAETFHEIDKRVADRNLS